MTEIKKLIYPQTEGADITVELDALSHELSISTQGMRFIVTTKAVGALEQLYNQLRVCDVEVVHE